MFLQMSGENDRPRIMKGTSGQTICKGPDRKTLFQ